MHARSVNGTIQRQETTSGLPAPIVVPILTSPEIALPCPSGVQELVPEFIRESREHAAAKLHLPWGSPPTRAELALEAWRFLARWRQDYPAKDPRNPTDSELAIASAEHYSYARSEVANGSSAFAMQSMIDAYTFIKDQLAHAGVEWVLSIPTDGNTPTKATRCQNDWGHKGVIDGLADRAADDPT